MKTCAVIPAAGLGRRLNIPIPKLLAPLTPTKTIWSVLRNNLRMVDHIHIVASPEGEPLLRAALQEDLANGFVTISIQQKPIGMGDAIFQGYPIWSNAQNILIVWGDQAFVSEETFLQALIAHAGAPKTIALPLTAVPTPYVEYLFDAQSRLIQVKQSRELELCNAHGLADVGTFVLSVPELFLAWNTYQPKTTRGSRTNEINFLPFLPYLVAQGWSVRRVDVLNPLEARGINTPEDLLFFQKTYEEFSQ